MLFSLRPTMLTQVRRRSTRAALFLSLVGSAGFVAAATANAATPEWPRIHSAIASDPALEAQVKQIVSQMSLAQKVGQMTQPEIKSITPAQVKQFYIGSVLNGGGTWPNGNKHASAADWVKLADQYYDASMATDMAIKVPVIWGIDAMHGNSNVYGATLFPHNIGLGAANNPALIKAMAAKVGQAVRATGINWVFAPTLAVVRDDRWGRTYESFSENPALVRSFGGEYVKGLQGSFKDAGNVVATAKHFMGDGGTDEGKDRGINKASKADMIKIHAQGYVTALNAGAQTVMASFHSWHDVAAGQDYGKMHGSKFMLTDVLKTKMGFDGFVVSDWDGLADVPGCTNASCPQSINAGMDMIMVPDAWQAFISNTIAQVNSGVIPMARIDDAVSRIVRVKLRAGMFGKRPSDNIYAGKDDALQARALARQAVQESLVLLKNNDKRLPLASTANILVVGKSAANLSNQSGGWSLTWQGTENTNADFAHADTILAAIESVVGKDHVSYSANAEKVDLSKFDAVIAVLGETPYAEGFGDIPRSGSMLHSARHPEDLAVLKAVAGKGKPVVTVFMSGRPMVVNDLLNLSDSFVAAWLPGTEGKGVTDLLFAAPASKEKPALNFKGRLSFSWPAEPCQVVLNAGDAGYRPLFGLGYGLRLGENKPLAQLKTDFPAKGCGESNIMPVFNQQDRVSYPLYVSDQSGKAGSSTARVAIGNDLNATRTLPTIRVENAQINTQQDAWRMSWSGPARLEARAPFPTAVPDFAVTDGVLSVDVVVTAMSQGAIKLTMECGENCVGTQNLSSVLAGMVGKGRQVVKVPLRCFAAQGVDFKRIEVPFGLTADAGLVLALTNIQIIGAAANGPDVLACAK